MSYTPWVYVQSDSTYFDVAVIGCGLIELLSQFGGDLCVSEGAQGFHHYFVPILADLHCWFGDIAHLSCGKTNTCKINIYVYIQLIFCI